MGKYCSCCGAKIEERWDKVGNMVAGQVGYVVPWAVTLDVGHHVGRNKTGTLSVKVKCITPGKEYTVDFGDCYRGCSTTGNDCDQ